MRLVLVESFCLFYPDTALKFMRFFTLAHLNGLLLTSFRIYFPGIYPESCFTRSQYPISSENVGCSVMLSGLCLCASRASEFSTWCEHLKTKQLNTEQARLNYSKQICTATHIPTEWNPPTTVITRAAITPPVTTILITR